MTGFPQVTGNNRSTIILPASGLHQFRLLLDEFIECVSTPIFLVLKSLFYLAAAFV